MRKASETLKLANVTDRIVDLLTITKLITVFEYYKTVDDAIKASEPRDEPGCARRRVRAFPLAALHALQAHRGPGRSNRSEAPVSMIARPPESSPDFQDKAPEIVVAEIVAERATAGLVR